jgi:hypothetical protein
VVLVAVVAVVAIAVVVDASGSAARLDGITGVTIGSEVLLDR